MFKVNKQLNYGRAVIAEMMSGLSSANQILDVGAGPGHDLIICRQTNPTAKLYALENFPPNVESLKIEEIAVFPIDIEREKIPLEIESLDVVVSNQVFEHVKEIFWINHEIARVLKVGGHIIVGVPNVASLHNRLLLLLGMQPTCIQNASAHIRGYTRHDLLRFFSKVFPGGYELEEFAGSNFYPFSPWLAKPLARVFPNMATSIFFKLKKVKNYKNEFLIYPKEQHLETPFYLG